jgi:F-type H+-transporting ATPase subunit delta
MRQSKVAKPYAKALFDLAVEQKQLDKVIEDIKLIKKVFEDSKELQIFLASPVVGSEKKQQTIKEVFKGKISDLSNKFFEVLFTRSREFILLDIANAFIDLYNKENGIAIANIQSASALDNSQKEAIFSYFKSQDASIKKLEIVEKIDDSLIGGFIATVDHKQIDKSVKTALNNVAKNFDNRHYDKKY